MAIKVIEKAGLVQANITRRIAKAKEMKDSAFRDAVLESLETGSIPRAQFKEGFNFATETRKPSPMNQNAGALVEFIGTGDYASAWLSRQRYEVDAGRDQEPILYPAVYSVVTDPSVAKTIDIYSLGAAGVVFEEVMEGGEVKFASVTSTNKTLTQRHWAVGIKYSEDLFIFNELFRVANLERQFGVAHNALLNHIHMSPILTYSYGSNNVTDGTGLTTFKTSASMPEKYLRAIEAGINHGVLDTVNRRSGPYAILCSTADRFTLERALNVVPQQGFDLQSSAINQIQAIVVYDGWTGTRGSTTTSYSGVGAGYAYLIDLSNRDMDFQSIFKQPLRQQEGNGEPTRFIMKETIWDTWFGVFADPARAVEKITLPVAASGAA